MRIVFFTHKHISHLFPIDDLLNLLSKYHDIFCVGYKEREEYFLNKNITFIPYPEKEFESLEKEINSLLKNEMIALKVNDIEKWYYYYTRKNAIKLHDITESEIQKLIKEIEIIKPDLVFHDIVDLYAPIICNRLNIKRYDYITNPLYSKKYFNTNPEMLYSILTFRFLMDHKFIENNIKDYWNKQRDIYFDVEKYYGLIPIPPMNQFEMTGEKNIIFNCSFLQQQYDKNNSIIVPPHDNQFKLEKSIDNELIEFIKKKNKIIYISHGSFLTLDIEYYYRLLEELKEFNVSFIISCGKNLNNIKKVVDDNNMNSRVYCGSFLPQKYILNNADLFITSGGFNSILESIYYKVPMLVDPISAEQRMNGYVIHELGIGESLCLKESLGKVKQITKNLLSEENYKKNVEKYNVLMKEEMSNRNEIVNSFLEKLIV